MGNKGRARVIKPSSKVQFSKNDISVFLAGSIEMGKAEDWQSRVEREIGSFDITIYNPRGDDWDSSWEQKETNPQFNHQVNWELSKLEECDIVLMYFSPETKSPISLLELGLYANTGKDMVVCCPNGFWRKGNVDIICSRYGIRLFDSLESGLGCVRTLLSAKMNGGF